MYSIKQSQCFDFLLKSIFDIPTNTTQSKVPKLVVNLNGMLWYGDFLRMKSNFIVQPYLDNLGDIEEQYFSTNNSDGIAIFNKASEAFSSLSSRQRYGIRRATDLSFLFDYLSELVLKLDLDGDASPIFPHLLNAKSLNDGLELPFFNLSGADKLNIVSIIEIEKQSDQNVQSQ